MPYRYFKDDDGVIVRMYDKTYGREMKSVDGNWVIVPDGMILPYELETGTEWDEITESDANV